MRRVSASESKIESMLKTGNDGRIPAVQRTGFAILGIFSLVAAFRLGIMFYRGFSAATSDAANAIVVLTYVGVCLAIGCIGVVNLYYALRRK